jgi:hypothetical protein
MKYWIRQGWFPIADQAVEQLGVLGVDVVEVREKLGELRIHVPAHLVRQPDVQAVVRAASARAARTCDICGMPGILRIRSGARRVRCEVHSDFESD